MADDSIGTKGFEANSRFTVGAFDNLELGTNISFLRIEDDKWGVTNVLGVSYFINEYLQPAVELAYI